jgi:hypothetical protein
MHSAMYAIESYEGAWQSGKDIDEGNLGHRPGIKGGYFPVPPVDSLQDIRSAMCLALEEMGLVVEDGRPVRDRREVRLARQEGRRRHDVEVRRAQRRA